MAMLTKSYEHEEWGSQGRFVDFGAVADSMHEGLQILDTNFRYLYFNDVAARDHAGSSKEALAGRRVRDVFEGFEDTAAFAALSRCMRERTAARLEAQLRCPDGSMRWFALRIEPVPQGLAVFSLDIDDQKRLEQEVTQARAQGAVARAAGGMVHDFNNLLTVITAACDLLERDPLPVPHQREELRQIRAASERGAELLRRLRQAARDERMLRVEVNDSLRELVPMLRTLVGPRVHFEVDHAPDVGAVRIDPVELDRVLINLVTNARDALAPGGRVELSTVLVEAPGSGEQVRIRVADDGCGMDAATRAKIFEAFFSTKGVTGGSGLGLPTCHDIVSRAGGRIAVHSEPGAGTDFDVLLPVSTQPVVASTPPPDGACEPDALPELAVPRVPPEA